jgi:uncharacterized protein (DUF1778 family)
MARFAVFACGRVASGCQYSVLTISRYDLRLHWVKGKDQQLQIRVTAAEKLAIQRAAVRAEMGMSEWVLAKLLPASAARFRDLTQALENDTEPNSHILAELNDLLAGLGKAELVTAVAEAPERLSNAYLANYVAAMVEMAAHMQGIPPPEWTADVAPLARPVFGAELQSLRLHLLLSSPPAFRRRNIFIDASVGDRV